MPGVTKGTVLFVTFIMVTKRTVPFVIVPFVILLFRSP